MWEVRWRRPNSVSVLVAFILIALASLVGGGVWVIRGTGETATAIYLASVPVTLTLLGQFLSSNLQHRREIDLELRKSKKEAYDAFVKWWMEMMTDKEHQKRMLGKPDALAKEMTAITQPITLWASNDVVRSYAEFRRLFRQNPANPDNQAVLRGLVHFEDMIFLMRKDMGHDPQGVRRYDFLSLFVNDLELFDEKGNKRD